MFYTFNQNNSGGYFDYYPEAGISHFVIIEADSLNEAVYRAKGIGLYWDARNDCVTCCGHRWPDYMTEYDQDEEPSIYREPVDDYLKHRFAIKWIDGFEAFVHYKDGRIEGRIPNPEEEK